MRNIYAGIHTHRDTHTHLHARRLISCKSKWRYNPAGRQAAALVVAVTEIRHGKSMRVCVCVGGFGWLCCVLLVVVVAHAGAHNHQSKSKAKAKALLTLIYSKGMRAVCRGAGRVCGGGRECAAICMALQL